MLYRSTDRGETWEQRPLPPAGQFPAIALVSDREGWVQELGPFGLNCATAVARFWHTTDAGASYEPIPPAGLPDRRCKSGFSFADASRGFVSDWAPGTAPRVHRTTDGGRTWTGSALPDPPGFTTGSGGPTLVAGEVRSFGTTLLADATAQTGTGVNAYLFRSLDGGATWTYLATVPSGAERGLGLATATRWLSLEPPAPRETTDAGASWHPYTSDYQQAAPVPPTVVFADASVGYATVRGSIQRTLDGGAHWSAIKTPGT